MFHLIAGRQKLTQVLKVTLLQIFLFLRVCVCIKTIPKTFLREVVDFLLKSTVNPLINALDVSIVLEISITDFCIAKLENHSKRSSIYQNYQFTRGVLQNIFYAFFVKPRQIPWKKLSLSIITC